MCLSTICCISGQPPQVSDQPFSFTPPLLFLETAEFLTSRVLVKGLALPSALAGIESTFTKSAMNGKMCWKIRKMTQMFSMPPKRRISNCFQTCGAARLYVKTQMTANLYTKTLPLTAELLSRPAAGCSTPDGAERYGNVPDAVNASDNLLRRSSHVKGIFSTLKKRKLLCHRRLQKVNSCIINITKKVC